MDDVFDFMIRLTPLVLCVIAGLIGFVIGSCTHTACRPRVYKCTITLGPWHMDQKTYETLQRLEAHAGRYRSPGNDDAADLGDLPVAKSSESE